MKHRRIIYPTPSGDRWRIACTCGWKHSVALADFPEATVGAVQEALDEHFVAHVPDAERSQYLKVDATPGSEGAWIMPEGTPCRFGNWREEGDVYLADVVEPVAITLPVGEVRTIDGRNFRLE